MQSIRESLMGVALSKRDELVERANTGADDDLAPEERPNRVEASPGCALKFGDEVEAYGGTYLYLCPGRGLGWCYVLSIEGTTIPLGQIEAVAVTDRIPMDPGEEPMPIFAEAPEPSQEREEPGP